MRTIATPSSPLRPGGDSLAGRISPWLALLLPLALIPLLLVLSTGEGSNRGSDELQGTGGTRTDSPRAQGAPEPAGAESQQSRVARSEEYPTVFADEHPALDFEFPCGVAGRIVDPRGRPLAEALVAAYEQDDQRLLGRALTSADGGFQIDGLPPEEYLTILVRHRDFAPAILDEVETAPGVRVPLGTITLQAGASLEGVVIGGAGATAVDAALVQPLAWIEGSAVPLPGAAVRTDSAGRFLLPGLPPGEIEVLVRAAGFAAQIAGPFSLPPGGKGPALAIRLEPCQALRGRILDRQDHPVAAATILYRPVPYLTGSEEITASSDAKGRFAITSPSPTKPFHLLVTHPEYLPLGTRFKPAAAQQELRLVLRRGAHLRVAIERPPEAGHGAVELLLDRSTRPSGEGKTSLLGPLSPQDWPFHSVGADLYESVPLDPAYTYRVRAVLADRWSAISEPLHLQTENSAAEPVRLVLAERILLSGEVLGSEGVPLEQALVILGRDTAELRLRTDEQGRFTSAAFGGAGHLDVWIQKSGYAPLEETLKLGTEPLEHTFHLGAGGSIHGRVTIGSEPPGYPLRLWMRSSGLDYQRSTRTEPDGSYEFKGLPLDETYEFYPLVGPSRAAGAATRFQHPIDDDSRFVFEEEYDFSIDLDEDQPRRRFDIALPNLESATLRGLVRDSSGPRAGQLVEISVFDTSFESRARTDARGAFTIEIPGGGEVDIDVLAAADGRPLWSGTEEVAAGQTREIEIDLHTAAVHGQVLGPDGTPIAAARVRFVLTSRHANDAHAPGGGLRAGTTDAKGIFRCSEVPEGIYRIEAQATGFAEGALSSVSIRAGVDPGELRIDLEPAAPLHLKITDAAGTAAAGAILECYSSAGDPLLVGGLRRLRVGRDGTVSIEHLKAGTYRFVLRRGSRHSQRTWTILPEMQNRFEWQLEWEDPPRSARPPRRPRRGSGERRDG